jgi:ABC-type nitrate/sulfonate/bicarbonate transport system permease component
MRSGRGLKTEGDARFLAGAGIAIVLAALMSQSRFARAGDLSLAILVGHAIVAIAPLLTIWFGSA